MSNFELVFPPPKFVIRRSAPSRFDRYRSKSSGRPSSFAASASSQRFFRYFVSVADVSDTDHRHVFLESRVLLVPRVGRSRLEPLDEKQALDDAARLVQRAHGAGREHLHRDVAERG